MRTLRNVIGSILALAGATAAVWSPFRIWYDGRHGRDYRIGELFTGTGVTEAGAQLFGSLFLPFAFAALVALAGVVLRSRLLVAASGLLVLAFTVLWMVRVGQAEGSMSVGGAGDGLAAGAGYALVGGVVLLLAALVMPGRRRGRRRLEPGPRHAAPYGGGPHDPGPYDDGPHDPGPHDPGPYDRGPHAQTPYAPDPDPHGDTAPYPRPGTPPESGPGSGPTGSGPPGSGPPGSGPTSTNPSP
ncbi:hypothetical protein [Streptomyces luteolus]|uniref:Integral membrane protein n=1 Tax=Streptomyces luteolus TaxID=3043615 RepID=A0ABT6T8K9_9ACTN|nr:hypothetical protein [Streptomyces sp. B-S-A12]MDI3424215.1 hypothetical protein [Streptomyces sp. B-S-A12]